MSRGSKIALWGLKGTLENGEFRPTDGSNRSRNWATGAVVALGDPDEAFEVGQRRAAGILTSATRASVPSGARNLATLNHSFCESDQCPERAQRLDRVVV